jgi:hypothetical protein
VCKRSWVWGLDSNRYLSRFLIIITAITATAEMASIEATMSAVSEVTIMVDGCKAFGVGASSVGWGDGICSGDVSVGCGDKLVSGIP